MPTLRRFKLIPWLFLTLTAVAADPPTLLPVDESPGHPAFHRFYRKFQRAVEDRDAAFVLSVIDDRIKLDFGGGEGRNEFIAQWKPSRRDGPLWKELDRIVALGCALDKGEDGTPTFSAPYAFKRWPEAFDSFNYILVAGYQVNYRKEPGGDAAVIRLVSWEIMEVVEKSEGDWVKLRAHDGTVGYVHADYASSSVGYRIGFEQDGKGGFKMTFFIAGD